VTTYEDTQNRPAKEADTAGLIDATVTTKNNEAADFAGQFAFTPADLDFRGFSASMSAAPRGVGYSELKDEYSHLWAEMAIRREKLPEVDSIVDRIVRHKDAYPAVERLTRVPWFAIAVIHRLEAGGDFNCHLHNGDSLIARTVHVPAGRPASGNPPFTWEESASDALHYDGLTQVTDWSIEHLAYLLEGFNGFAYRMKHPNVKSPYLWSYSNHYTSGKYVGDGQWSATAVSGQCGAMVLLKRLQERGEIRLDYARPDMPVPVAQPAAATALSRVTADLSTGGFPEKTHRLMLRHRRGRWTRSWSTGRGSSAITLPTSDTGPPRPSRPSAKSVASGRCATRPRVWGSATSACAVAATSRVTPRMRPDATPICAQ
jgi:lysozyme family protein